MWNHKTCQVDYKFQYSEVSYLLFHYPRLLNLNLHNHNHNLYRHLFLNPNLNRYPLLRHSLQVQALDIQALQLLLLFSGLYGAAAGIIGITMVLFIHVGLGFTLLMILQQYLNSRKCYLIFLHKILIRLLNQDQVKPKAQVQVLLLQIHHKPISIMIWHSKNLRLL